MSGNIPPPPGAEPLNSAPGDSLRPRLLHILDSSSSDMSPLSAMDFALSARFFNVSSREMSNSSSVVAEAKSD